MLLKVLPIFVLCLALDAVSAQSCSDTRLYANRQDTSCRSYTQCVNGLRQTQTCNNGMVFYEAMQQCVLANSYICGGAQPYCPQPNGDFPYATDCTRYLYCTNGNSLIRNCQAGYVFDTSSYQCKFQTGSINCQSSGNPGNIYQCPSSYGKYADPSDTTCRYYYNCNNSQGTRTQCTQNLLFHPGLSQCVTSDSYRCGGWNFNCPSPNGDFADPQNPNYYYYCINNYPLRRYCQNGQVFDSSLRRCSSSGGNIANGCPTYSTAIQCNSGQSGNWSNPSDYTCRTYYQCQNYQQIQTTCTSNFVYYPGLQKCVVPDSYDCNNPNQFVCPQPNKDFQDPYNNRRYYYCMGSCPLRRTCPGSQVYNGDPNVQRCQ